MLKKLTKFDQRRFLIFIGFTLLVLLMHKLISANFGDDEIFSQALKSQDLLPYLEWRYNQWSSRILIEAILVSVSPFSFLWKILDCIMILVIVFSISKIFIEDKKIEFNILVIGLFFIVPFKIFSGAGWMATTINYLWPLALGLFAMIPIKKILYEQSFKKFEYPLYTLALIIASNQEQMCLILLSVHIIFTIYIFLQKKPKIFMFVNTIICLLSFIFIITTPGNATRRMKEITTWFNDFDNISFIRKIEMAYSSSLFEFIIKPNFVFILFSGLLLAAVILLNRKTIYKVISCIPFIVSISFLLSKNIFNETFPGLQTIANSMTIYGTGATLSSIKTLIPDAIITLVLFSFLISLYVLFENKKLSLLSILIFLLGFGSRMMMALSPTIWVSGDRTFTFLYFSFIILSLIIFQQISNFKSSKVFLAIISGISFISYISFIS